MVSLPAPLGPTTAINSPERIMNPTPLAPCRADNRLATRGIDPNEIGPFAFSNLAAIREAGGICRVLAHEADGSGRPPMAAISASAKAPISRLVGT